MSEPMLPGGGADAVAERRSRLLAIKLRALLRDHLDDDTVDEPGGFAPGAAVVHGDAGWVLLDDDPQRRLGASLAWAVRSGVQSLNVVAGAGTGVLARRAGEFELPISVWFSSDRDLLSAVAEPILEPASTTPEHEVFRSTIVEAGAEPVVEHGVLAGEVCGLEVCRVVDDAFTGEPRLEVGVGAHDREAFQMLHGDTPSAESLARIVETVRVHREPGAKPHPLNRLGAERLLRWRLQQSPDLVGAVSLKPVSPPVPRYNLKDPTPCVATGTGVDGATVVVVCSSGVDLELVPFAADARLAAAGAVEPGVGDGGTVLRLVMVVPSRDRLRLTGEIAGLLRQSASFVSLD